MAEDADEGKMPVTQHLRELRKRLIVCFIAVGVGFVISYVFADRIYELLMLPWIHAIPKGQFIYTAPHEAFFVYMKASFIAGLGLAVPVLLYQLWAFIAPGLYENERKYLLPVVFASSFFYPDATEVSSHL